jgi:hypothetical protein
MTTAAIGVEDVEQIGAIHEDGPTEQSPLLPPKDQTRIATVPQDLPDHDEADGKFKNTAAIICLLLVGKSHLVAIVPEGHG